MDFSLQEVNCILDCLKYSKLGAYWNGRDQCKDIYDMFVEYKKNLDP